MESLLYAITAGVIILWSVWSYSFWSENAGLPEDSSFRNVLIILPSSLFLLIALSGWRTEESFRFDLFAIIFLDVVTILCAIALLGVRIFARHNPRAPFLAIISIWFFVAVVTVVSAHVLKASPPLIMRINDLLAQLERINLFSFSWLGVDPETREQDFVRLLNRAFIAILSYIPVSLVRYITVRRQTGKLSRELRNLRSRLENLERRLETFTNE